MHRCQVVPFHSAIIPGYAPIGIHANHMNMTKFDTIDNPGFIAVAGELRRWARALDEHPDVPRYTQDERDQCLQSLSNSLDYTWAKNRNASRADGM